MVEGHENAHVHHNWHHLVTGGHHCAFCCCLEAQLRLAVLTFASLMTFVDGQLQYPDTCRPASVFISSDIPPCELIEVHWRRENARPMLGGLLTIGQSFSGTRARNKLSFNVYVKRLCNNINDFHNICVLKAVWWARRTRLHGYPPANRSRFETPSDLTSLRKKKSLAQQRLNVSLRFSAFAIAATYQSFKLKILTLAISRNICRHRDLPCAERKSPWVFRGPDHTKVLEVQIRVSEKVSSICNEEKCIEPSIATHT